ncbi:hypothetical protein ACNI65_21630 [Roseateles sp. So40a]|uniref:hypothetical protein n=1 Tax=Roseateles sp. So40a TaxID=3400226 RepID=UPI003A890BEF
MTLAVPDDFPHPPFGGSLSGMQLKFSLTRGPDGRFHEPGSLPEERAGDFLRCCEVVDWAVGFLREKALKPKYAALTTEQMLEKFSVNLANDFEMPESYRSWILARLTDRLGQR